MPGTFVFKPLEAKLVHDTDLIGKMNPYCSFSIGQNKSISEVCQEGGKNPHWNNSITLSTLSDESTANLEVIDKEIYDILMMKDDLIGSCAINLKEIESEGQLKRWYPLSFKNKPAGEILMEATFAPQGGRSSHSSTSELKSSTLSASKEEEKLVSKSLATSTLPTIGDISIEREEKLINSQIASLIKEEIVDAIERPIGKTYIEQHQIVEPHTFMKTVEATEMMPVQREIEVMEPRKVLKEVQFTELVPVVKRYDVVEPVVIIREVDAVEPQVVTRYVKVVEDVRVKKMIEIIEMHKEMKEVTTYEPRTVIKHMEVIEQVPVKKLVELSEAVTVTKQVEFIEPVITTQTIVMEVVEPVVIGEQITLEVGPATILGQEQKVAIISDIVAEELTSIQEIIREEKELVKELIKEEEIELKSLNKSNKPNKHNKH